MFVSVFEKLGGTGCLTVRFRVGLLAFLGFINLYIVRVQLSVSILAMVKQNITAQHNIIATQCYGPNSTWGMNETKNSPSSGNSSTGSDVVISTGEFDWNERTQGLILSIFFYGYGLTQIVGGRAAELYGGTRVFGVAIAGSGFLSLLIPVCARQSYLLLLAIRFIQGLVQGPSWPSMHAITAQWIPAEERSKFMGPVYFATHLGIIIAMPVCGILTDELGWESACYFAGAVAMLWGLVWFLYTSPTPATHSSISREERDLIEGSVRETGTSKDQSVSPPWKKILTSPAVWVIVLLEFGNSWGFAIFLTQIPTYLKNVLGFSMKKNGLVSALPFLSRYIGVNIFSFLCHVILSRKLLSLGTTRKTGSVFALLLPALCLIPVAYSGCRPVLNIGFLCLAMFFNGANSIVSIANIMDISPNYAGTLLGMANTAGSLSSFLAPVLTGLIINDQQTVERWRLVFWTCIPTYGVTQILYLCFSSAEIQPWNYVGQKEEGEENEGVDEGEEKKKKKKKKKEEGEKKEKEKKKGKEEKKEEEEKKKMFLDQTESQDPDVTCVPRQEETSALDVV
ncbi:putative transporter slc-17.2 isoform X2 [Oratosquilla oratoria]|uniref:putative transporter slc-17.2 isoform X2 n=1 Tax=Oratosquilla oratoria TaxID=337810 RepID=UPI003F758AFD